MGLYERCEGGWYVAVDEGLYDTPEAPLYETAVLESLCCWSSREARTFASVP